MLLVTTLDVTPPTITVLGDLTVLLIPGTEYDAAPYPVCAVFGITYKMWIQLRVPY